MAILLARALGQGPASAGARAGQVISGALAERRPGHAGAWPPWLGLTWLRRKCTRHRSAGSQPARGRCRPTGR
ncbi:hypothetical protein G6F22_021548 [Rhizopus arrhizus]|nr:hypothetical protein G6F22_021548 [Rhizopus arrhizus]